MPRRERGERRGEECEWREEGRRGSKERRGEECERGDERGGEREREWREREGVKSNVCVKEEGRKKFERR